MKTFPNHGVSDVTDFVEQKMNEILEDIEDHAKDLVDEAAADEYLLHAGFVDDIGEPTVDPTAFTPTPMLEVIREAFLAGQKMALEQFHEAIDAAKY